MISCIKLTIKNQVIELTIDELLALRSEIERLCGSGMPVPRSMPGGPASPYYPPPPKLIDPVTPFPRPFDVTCTDSRGTLC